MEAASDCQEAAWGRLETVQSALNVYKGCLDASRADQERKAAA